MVLGTSNVLFVCSTSSDLCQSAPGRRSGQQEKMQGNVYNIENFTLRVVIVVLTRFRSQRDCVF